MISLWLVFIRVFAKVHYCYFSFKNLKRTVVIGYLTTQSCPNPTLQDSLGWTEFDIACGAGSRAIHLTVTAARSTGGFPIFSIPTKRVHVYDLHN